MKILLLGNGSESVLAANLRDRGEQVSYLVGALELNEMINLNPDFIISYNYRYIIKSEVIEAFPDRMINLHTSYLPWNRGAHPNFWSVWDDTPKGVSIHYIDAGLDTGDIIVQKLIYFEDAETLKSTYDTLQREIQELFLQNWEKIKNGTNSREKQQGNGSFHRARDIEEKWDRMCHGWKLSLHDVRALKERSNCEK